MWFLFGGLFLGLGWCVTGVLWCLTLIGIPVGVQCFKLAGMAFWPFGKEVVHSGGTGSFLLNLFWLLGGGASRRPFGAAAASFRRSSRRREDLPVGSGKFPDTGGLRGFDQEGAGLR